MKNKLIIFFFIVSGVLKAQQEPLQYFRPNNKMGINIYETTKNDTIPFSGFAVRVGGNFTQDFQALKHQNSAVPVYDVNGVNTNQLVSLTQWIQPCHG